MLAAQPYHHLPAEHGHSRGLIALIVHSTIWHATGRAVSLVMRDVPVLGWVMVIVVLAAFVVYVSRRRGARRQAARR